MAEDPWAQFRDADAATTDVWAQFKDAPAQKPAPDIGTDMAKGLGYGANIGVDAGLNMIGGLVRGPVNAISGALGYGDVIPELQLARRLNKAPPETQPGRVMQAIGEVVGSSVLPAGGMAVAGRAMGAAAPGILSSYAAAPARAVGIDAASSVGGGLGVAAARENDLGSVGEIGLGLAGGFLAPNAVNMAARTYGAADSALRYGNRAIQNARNPEQAAVDAEYSDQQLGRDRHRR